MRTFVLFAHMETWNDFLSDKLMDLANYVAAALIFGQLLADRIEWRAFIFGVAFLIASYMVSFCLRERGKS